MKHFNYNPFTWKSEIGDILHYIDDTGVCTVKEVSGYPNSKWHKGGFGVYKTKEDAQLALEIAREAIVNNVKE